jgi:cysteine desulfurase / selenocysteine lyase
MNLPDLKNEVVRQKEFPVCKESTFLAHAGVCPLPSRVNLAMAEYMEACTRGDQEDAFPAGRMLECRKLAASLLECSPTEIALVGPTSIGLSMVAEGLEWKSGDNVVFYQDDYPSNVVPWMALEKKGVEPRRIQTQTLGCLTLKDISGLVDKRTRLVALASAHFISGFRLNLDEIGAWLRSQGVLFCVDGIQTVGAVSTKVTHADFLAADAHKWLLGPCAAGILYVRKEVQEQLRPLMLGWNNVRCPGYVMPSDIELPSHAGRYEAGSPNLIGIVGLHASLQLLIEYGMEAIEKRLIGFSHFFRSELKKDGFQIANPHEDSLTGITSFRREGVDMLKLHQKLKQKKITCSLRQTRSGDSWIRFSPHFYNTESELEQTLKILLAAS